MEPPGDRACRVIALTFRAADGGDFADKFLVLGHVEVLGAPTAAPATEPVATSAPATERAGGPLRSVSSSANGVAVELVGQHVGQYVDVRPRAASPVERRRRRRRRRDRRRGRWCRWWRRWGGGGGAGGGAEVSSIPLGLAMNIPSAVSFNASESPDGRTTEIEYGDRAMAAMNAAEIGARPSLESLLELERDRLRLGLLPTSRDGVLAARGLSPGAPDFDPLLRRDAFSKRRRRAQTRARGRTRRRRGTRRADALPPV